MKVYFGCDGRCTPNLCYFAIVTSGTCTRVVTESSGSFYILAYFTGISRNVTLPITSDPQNDVCYIYF